ncbi:hypothetical protein A6U86_11145 [Rhizobium sp. AC27/96]|nr:hypothetical protein A6U86_11145 [Rhizobium sp. AC27/96]
MIAVQLSLTVQASAERRALKHYIGKQSDHSGLVGIRAQDMVGFFVETCRMKNDRIDIGNYGTASNKPRHQHEAYQASID